MHDHPLLTSEASAMRESLCQRVYRGTHTINMIWVFIDLPLGAVRGCLATSLSRRQVYCLFLGLYEGELRDPETLYWFLV